MTQLRFDPFTQAYRETYSAELDDQALRRRLQGTLGQRARRRPGRRWVAWLYGMGLTTALGATLAYASPLAPTLLDWMDSALATSLTTSPATSSKAVAPPSETPTPSRSTPSASTLALPAAASSIAIVSSPAAPNGAAITAGGASKRGSAEGRKKTGAEPSERSPTVSRPSAAVEDAPSLYATAQRLQFDEHNYAAALSAWDRYLATPNSTLTADARYNHAVCLIQLKRYGQARTELTRLAGPRSPSAYRGRATTLLHSLDASSK